jgi:hypothetical protein
MVLIFRLPEELREKRKYEAAYDRLQSCNEGDSVNQTSTHQEVAAQDALKFF